MSALKRFLMGRLWSSAFTLVALCALAALAPPLAQANPGPVEEEIRHNVEELRQGRALRFGDEGISTRQLLPAFYEARAFQPAWTPPGTVDQLLASIRASELEGLLPRDYHLGAITGLREQFQASGGSDPQQAAALDLMLTDALIRLAYHLQFGKVNPEKLDPAWNMTRELDGGDPVAMLQRMLDAPNLSDALDALKPNHPFYMALRKALADYRAIAARGGWRTIPPGPSLKPGMRDPRVKALRERLTVTGELSSSSTAKDKDRASYDGQLTAAVRRFQERHLLEVDGAMGTLTLEALNVPVAQRIDQIRVNLERARWVLNQIPEPFVVVDIAGFRVFWVENGQMMWSTRAQVGRPYRKTPTLRSRINYIVLNPTWTVPPTVLDQDMLPAIKRDPAHLSRLNIKVLTPDGRPVDPGSINWSHYSSGKNIPYILRQDAGAKNSLGRIKIMFPNDHSVYLHDTPKKQLFKHAERSFSSGCIRVEEPLKLAERLLGDPKKWNSETLQAAINGGETRTLVLAKPVPVLLFYWTMALDEAGGGPQFRRDIYDRDHALLEALDGEFRPRPYHTWM